MKAQCTYTRIKIYLNVMMLLLVAHCCYIVNAHMRTTVHPFHLISLFSSIILVLRVCQW